MKLQFFRSYWIDILILVTWFFILLWLSPDLFFYLGSPDQGYQITAGKMILLGYIPFRDFFLPCGPLVAYTSAFGELVSNSLIGETLICCLGYSLSLYIIYYLVSKQSSKIIGLLASIIGFLLLARFYKWYYWLFPLLALFCIYQILEAKRENDNKWLYISGFICGVCGLYRLDLSGALFIVFMILIIFFLPHKKGNIITSVFIKIIPYIISFLIPFVIWGIFLQANSGSFIESLLVPFDYAIGTIQYWSIPVPPLDFTNLFSSGFGIALAFRLVPISLIVGIGYSFWRIKSSENVSSKYVFLLFSSILGIFIFPEAINRADFGHLLIIIPPSIIVVPIFLFDFWKYAVSLTNHFKKIFFMSIILLYLITVLFAGLTISQSGILGGADLVKFNENPLSKLVQINAGPKSIEYPPVSNVISIIQNNTSPSESILIIPPQHQLYFFINRPMSGMNIWYGPGLLDQEKWRQQNYEKILANPPKMIIVKDNFSDGYTDHYLYEYQPELYNFIIKNYTSVVYQNQGWVILKRTEN